MADFTPYGGNESTWGHWARVWGKGHPTGTGLYASPVKDMFASIPAYERMAGGNFDRFEAATYDSMARRIKEQEQLAYRRYMDRMRRVGVGASPVADVTWGERMQPQYDQRYADAADAAVKTRTTFEADDLARYNTAMQSRTAYMNQLMDSWANARRQEDLQKWQVNTNAGFKNREMSLRRGSEDDGTAALLGALGKIGGTALGAWIGGPAGAAAGGNIGQGAMASIGGGLGGNSQTAWADAGGTFFM